MFQNKHRTHDYQDFTQAAKYLRDTIKQADKQKWLEKDYAESFILKIREQRLLMEKSMKQFNADVDRIFKDLMKTLTLRKEAIKREILERFEPELAKLREQEDRWIEKEAVTKKILEASTFQQDEPLLLLSSTVLNGLDLIKEELKTVKYTRYFDLDTRFKIDFSDVKKTVYEVSKSKVIVEVDCEDIGGLFDGLIRLSPGVPLELKC